MMTRREAFAPFQETDADLELIRSGAGPDETRSEGAARAEGNDDGEKRQEQ